MKTWTYIEDTTGSGDEATLTLPAWAEPPEKLVIYQNHDRYEFLLDDRD